MKMTPGITAAALAVVFGAGLIFAPLSARASEEGHRNTTLALGALSAYLLLTQKNKLPGLLAAGGAAYAYSQWDKSIRERHVREARYRNGYYRNGYNYSPRPRYYQPSRPVRRYAPVYNREYHYAQIRDGRHDNGKHKGWYKGKHNGWDKHHYAW